MSKVKKGKKFLYNLETVLKFRKIRETQEREKFVKAERKFVEEKDKEEKLKDFQKEKYHELTGKMSGGQTIDFQQVIMRRAHLEVVKQQVVEQAKVREEAERKKEEQRQELVKVVKDKKILDKDKEKKRGFWQKLMEKEAGKFLDEIATIRFEHRRRQDAEDKAHRKPKEDQ